MPFENETQFHETEFYGSFLSIASITNSCISILSSLICFIVLQFFLRLNSYVKNILKIHAVMVFISYGLVFFGNILLGFEISESDLVPCCLISYPVWIADFSGLNVSFIVSSVRLHLSKEAAKTKIPDSWKVWTFIFCAYLFNTTIATSSFFLYYYFEVENESLYCAKIKPAQWSEPPQ